LEIVVSAIILNFLINSNTWNAQEYRYESTRYLHVFCTHGTLHTAQRDTHTAYACDAMKEEEFADRERTRTEFKF